MGFAWQIGSTLDAAKRIVAGHKLASHQLGDTLLPKRITLPIFASGALSPMAYVLDEVLITLPPAGMVSLESGRELVVNIRKLEELSK